MMSLSHHSEIARANGASPMNGALMEKVIIGNDLSGLTPLEKVQYVKSICHSLGLNPLTKPIQLLKFQGKEIPYTTKDASEQLRKLNKVSITKLEGHLMDGVYVVTATASTPDGRQDSSTGAIATGALKGEALANAFMKAETKAKRRVTLSICGLGFLDESEIESMVGAKRIEVSTAEVVQATPSESLKIAFDGFLAEMEEAMNEKTLKSIFDKIKMINWQGTDHLAKLIAAKDARKNELSTEKFLQEFDKVDVETGEVTEVSNESV